MLGVDVKNILLQKALFVLKLNNLDFDLQDEIEHELTFKTEHLNHIGYISRSDNSISIYISECEYENKTINVEKPLANWMCWWDDLYIINTRINPIHKRESKC